MEQIPTNIKAYGFKESKRKGEILKYRVKPLGTFDADIVIAYCGVCHGDVHMIDNDWGISSYPLVPGHEIVGRVIGVGSEVTNIKVGDSICMGALCQSCYDCDLCHDGYDNLCAKRAFTYFDNVTDETGTHRHYGGFGSYMRTDLRKLFPIPPGLEEKYVGPLMCAGITVFEPI